MVAGGLASSRLPAQVYLSSPDNWTSGSNFFSAEAEIGGAFYADNAFSVNSNMTVGGCVTVGTIYAGTLFASAASGGATDLTLTGEWDFRQSFDPQVEVIFGVGGSWLHGSIDVGDLTYLATNTPAFNIEGYHEESPASSIVFFTGYDGNTTWSLRQNGWTAMQSSNSTLLIRQLTLTDTGNLTVYGAGSGQELTLVPETGGVKAGNQTARLLGTNAVTASVSLRTGNATVVFTDLTNSAVATITPASATAAFSSGIQGLAFGAGASANGASAFAFGHDVDAAYYASIVLGQWNSLPVAYGPGNISSWQAADPLFVIANGADANNRSNAWTVLKNGATVINGNVTFNGNVSASNAVFSTPVVFAGNVSVAQAQGDIPMAQP